MTFEKKLGYTFKDKSLLDQALTQSGYSAIKNNERLEFLGDRVLGLTVAYLLYEKFPDENEGFLAQRHAALVSSKSLAIVADKLGMQSVLKRAHLTTGDLTNVMADAMEAIFAAIYIEAGADVANKVIVNLFQDMVVESIELPKDPKTMLQEYVQSFTVDLPKYRVDTVSGPAHEPEFVVTVTALDKSATAIGSSKKNAMREAADAWLSQFMESK